MNSEQVRKIFLEYFTKLGHTVVQSSPVVPLDDPTLLFTNAGMNQFKDIFVGKIACPYEPPRAASTQKCIRVSGKHNDLEEVGKDEYHHTFFEMLGNWSFGDYFKQEAIQWAWELLTEQYKIPPEKLWAAVHYDDKESAQIWKNIIGLDERKIVRCGDEDNFWEMAETGPCGPTTEIHYDWGEKFDPDQSALPNSSPRFVEVWNIVFMQYFRNPDGSLDPLPAKNVDTGMGFERLVAILQGTRDDYSTDLFAPMIDTIAEISGHRYDENDRIRMAFRVLADHIRALAFAIADGALPGNTGRGYVLRRILRRAARFSRILDIHKPIVWKLVSPLIDKMGPIYPELLEKAPVITHIIKSEEERFGKTLDYGIELFEEIADRVISAGENEISGEDAFKLYDTYGFPLDLTRLMASERGLTVNMDEFEGLMEQQRQRARSTGTFSVEHQKKQDWIKITDGEDSYNLCYETESTEAEIRLFRRLSDDKIEIVLSQTPFYAESGGQIGDTGKIYNKFYNLNVIDTRYEGEHIVHICAADNAGQSMNILENIRAHPQVKAEIEHQRRDAIRKNHTATHLLHRALRSVLGTHIRQAGSMVAHDRLRFDYTHYETPTIDQLEKIERIVNEVIQNNLPVSTQITSYQDAIDEGAIALFGEKYGSKVRMVKINDFSKELCGGTHIDSTGKLGLFLITDEQNIGSGMRRIEAITGLTAVHYAQSIRRKWSEIKRKLSATEDEVLDRLDKLFDELSDIRKKQEKLSDARAETTAENLLESALQIEQSKVIISKVTVRSRDELLKIVSDLEKNVSSGVILLGAVLQDGKVAFVCSVTEDMINSNNIKAGEIVRQVATVAGGSGGGRPDFAQAGGNNPKKLDSALKLAEKIILHKIRN